MSIKCVACGKKKNVVLSKKICPDCTKEAARRKSKGICIKCNKKLPPNARNMEIHLGCKNQNKPCVGY